jgi:hypothetical protein
MPWRPDATRATGILACSRPNSRRSAPGVTVEWPETRRGAHAKRHARVAISQHAPGASLSGWTRASRRALSLRLPGRVGFRWRALAARLCRAVARCTALLLLVLACLSGTFLLFPDLLMEGGSWHWNRLSLRVRGEGLRATCPLRFAPPIARAATGGRPMGQVATAAWIAELCEVGTSETAPTRGYGCRCKQGQRSRTVLHSTSIRAPLPAFLAFANDRGHARGVRLTRAVAAAAVGA